MYRFVGAHVFFFPDCFARDGVVYQISAGPFLAVHGLLARGWALHVDDLGPWRGLTLHVHHLLPLLGRVRARVCKNGKRASSRWLGM